MHLRESNDAALLMFYSSNSICFFFSLFFSLCLSRRHHAERLRKETIPTAGPLPSQTDIVVDCLIVGVFSRHRYAKKKEREKNTGYRLYDQ